MNKSKKLNKQIEELNSNTLLRFFPLWCENVADNIEYIKKYKSVTSLMCNSHPICWKVERLRQMSILDKKPEFNIAMNECQLNLRTMEIAMCLIGFKNVTLSGSEACNGCVEHIVSNKPALVIGGGPSLDIYNHLDILKKYGFEGDIFCVSSVLKEVLEHGIIPKYFGSLDAEVYDTQYIDHKIIHDNTDKLNGLFGIIVHPTTNELFKGNRYFYNPYFYSKNGGNISNTFQMITKTPTITTGGNVGSSLISLASSFGYNPIVLIGMDLSFPTFDNMKEYYKNSQYSCSPNPKEIVWTPDKYAKGYNSDFKKEYYIDQSFNGYRTATLVIINSIVDFNHKVINCTEQGSLHSDKVISIKFEEYLKSQEKSSPLSIN